MPMPNVRREEAGSGMQRLRRAELSLDLGRLQENAGGCRRLPGIAGVGGAGGAAVHTGQ